MAVLLEVRSINAVAFHREYTLEIGVEENVYNVITVSSSPLVSGILVVDIVSINVAIEKGTDSGIKVMISNSYMPCPCSILVCNKVAFKRLEPEYPVGGVYVLPASKDSS